MLKRLLDWLEKYLPGLLLAFGIGYKEGREELEKLEKKLLESETKRKLLENELVVREVFAGKSSDDVIRDILRAGTPGDSSESEPKKPG